MIVSATTRHLLAAFLLLMLPALTHAQAVHDTGTAQLQVFANGFFGTTPPDFAELPSFFFEGDNGLFHSSFVVGASQDQVSGNYYGGDAMMPPVESEWATVSGPDEIDAPFAEPFADFDQGFEAMYNDSDAPNPIGLDVTQRSYSDEGDAFVVVEFEITNTSGADLTGIYPGLFADWDIGGATGFGVNLGGYDEETRLLYTFDDSGNSDNYFGLAALGSDDDAPVSGVAYDGLGGPETDADIYGFLTNIFPEPQLPDDRRTTLGVGPYDIADGASIVVRYAFVGGSSLDDIVENAASAQSLFVTGPPALEEAIHDTGLVQFEVYADGNFGTSSPSFAGTGFLYDGIQGLFASTFLVGQAVDQVSGMAYESGEWVTVDSLSNADAPDDFDQAFSATYDDSGAANPIGIEVNQLSYSSSDDDRDGFVIVEFEITNTSGADLTGIYPGIFADWDVGSATANLGGYDEEARLLYVFDDDGTPGYFGVAALTSNVSGDNLQTGDGMNPTEESLYTSLTTDFPDPAIPDDLRATLGVGPYDIAAGESVTATFAFVGGTDLDELLANACAAQQFGETQCEDVATEETTEAGTFTLHSAYPNPFASATTLGFTLPAAERVTLTVYDLLGRRVATLAEGLFPEGSHSVRFDASSLPSGVYVYRLSTDSADLTERVSLVR